MAWRADALAEVGDRVRLVAPESLHLTLAFLGARPEPEVPAIGSAVAAAVEGLGAALLRPGAVVGVPPRRPRLLALDLVDDGGRAGAVQAAVSDALVAGGFYTPEKRPFWPHVTIARVKRDARIREVGAEPPDEPFSAAEVTLYRSRLSPRGARYEALARAELRG